MADLPRRFRENIVLYGALLANVGIAIAKFVAAAISGSSSMLTEGVHSLVDSGNQVLLLYGQAKARRPADATHPFGYGRELYFWAFVVAILIFAVGAGVSIYEGWLHIAEPEPLRDPTINYVVLAVAVLLEGTSWAIAVREFNGKRGSSSWWQSIRRSKDPAGFIVLFEDSAALIGLGIAGIGVWASHHYADPRIDGVASIRGSHPGRGRHAARARSQGAADRRKCRSGDHFGVMGHFGQATTDQRGQSCAHDPHRARCRVRGDQCRFRR